MKLLVIGAGFSGARIARGALADGEVVTTRRTLEGCAELTAQGFAALEFAGSPSADMHKALSDCTHLIVCSAPDRCAPFRDPVLAGIKSFVEHSSSALTWIGYLSTIGVYGDHSGAWVDEESACRSEQVRSQMRLQAEQAWQQLAVIKKVPMAIFRLSGIYGPGRNPILDAHLGRARIIIKKDQVFNRIHVDDLAVAVIKAMRLRANQVLNITDGEPAPNQDVVRFAHALIGKQPPEAICFDDAELSEMARSFYAERKRVSNVRSREQLQFEYRYSDYRAGLTELWRSGCWH